jgi:hypothetical protein
MTDITPPADPNEPPDPPNASHVERIFVTPQIAKDWLAATAQAGPHFRNRRRDPKTVALFRRLLREGKLDLITDAIGITPEGWIVNGQHRLAAIMAEDIGAWLYVAYDMPADAFSRIDTGRVRNGSTVLELAGYPSTSGTAALARLVWSWEHGKTNFPSNALHVNDDLYAYVRAHPDLVGTQECDPVPYGKKWAKNLPGVPQRYISLFAWLLRDDDSGFLAALVEDDGDNGITAASLLRKTYAARANRGQDRDYRKTVALFVKARNLWPATDLPTSLKISDRDPFPIPEFPVPAPLGNSDDDEDDV